MATVSRKLLGQSLVEMGLIDEKQLAEAIVTSRADNVRLGNVLVARGLVTEYDIAKVVASQLKLEFLDLRDAKFHPDAVKLVPEPAARRLSAVPVSIEDGVLTVAVADPRNVVALNELSFLTNSKLRLLVMTESDIHKAIERVYINRDYGGEDQSAGPIVRIVETILQQAWQEQASDIHIEPWEDLTRLRYRIDGSLVEINQIDKALHPGIVSRIKIMADLDISERRLPQDGSIRYQMDHADPLDLRVSTIPTIAGEKVVIRLLNQSGALSTVDELGMDEQVAASYERLLKYPYGMLLVCGPTGSGKSTTLYIALQILNRPDHNIMTIEDPVEYRVEGVNQVQINTRAGVSFANILRSVVRQDPNIIMIGEVRDSDTADIAVRSALTGHLVLSTLHTNDAPGAVTRLIDMGVEPYLVASSVIGVLSQRLVRKVCDSCAEEYEAGPHHPHVLALGLEPGTYRFRRGRGCARCHNTGYRGRTGLFELMPITEGLRELIVKTSPTNLIRRQALDEGMVSLADDGIRKVLEGTTTVEEVLRVTLLNQGG